MTVKYDTHLLFTLEIAMKIIMKYFGHYTNALSLLTAIHSSYHLLLTILYKSFTTNYIV